MGTNKKSSWKEARKAERNRQLVMLAVPIVLILLIIIIVVADRSGKEETNTTETETTGTAAAMPPESGQSGDGTDGSDADQPSDPSSDPSGEGPDETETPAETEAPETQAVAASHLEVDAVPEINALMSAYYEARAKCDAEKLNQLYGKTETDVAKLEATRKQLLLYARYIVSVDEIVCYTAKMEDQNVWLVYATSKFHFRPTETPVPTIQWVMVTQDEEGNYLIMDSENLTEEQTAFKHGIDMSDEARLLSTEYNGKMKDAIMSDSALIEIYGTLNSGSPLWDTGETETEPEVQILTE